MSKTVQLSAKQCRRARALLQWNLQDIVSRCTLSRVRLEQFERGDVPLTRIENEILLKVFLKNGIIVNARGDVLMREDNKTVTEEVVKDDNTYIVNNESGVSENLNHQRVLEEEEERKRRLAAETNPTLRD